MTQTTTPTAQRISADFPFESQHVDVLDATLHYVDVGEGRPVLFLHGNPTSSYLWRNIIPHVVPIGRCIAVDLVGMGKSTKPQSPYRFFDHARYLEAFIDALKLDDLVLVLHDWGSALGFDWASRHEDMVRGLAFMESILLPVPGWEVFPDGVREAFRAFRTPDLGWELLVRENRFIEEVLPGSIIRTLGQKELDAYRQPFLREEDRTPLWRWPNELPIAGEPADVKAVIERYSSWLQQTNLPKLLLYAEPGVLVPAPVVEWARAKLQHLTTVGLGAGIHYVQEDHPQTIGREIVRWMGAEQLS